MALTGQIQYFVTRGPGQFQFKTTDSVATCLGASYFNTPNDLVPLLHAGDVIEILVVANHTTLANIITDSSTVLVTSILSGVVVVTAMGGSGLSGSTNAVNLNPIYSPQHTTYQVGVYDGPNDGFANIDEFITIGYNNAGATATEPAVAIKFEIDWQTTARGVAGVRTEEAYWSFSGPASVVVNETRAIFFSFEPGDTSQGSSGELLYGYLSTGFNRFDGAVGGGGFYFNTDGQGGGTTLGIVDIDGCRFNWLRAAADISAITSAAGNPITILVGAGHGFKIGARIQIYKAVTAGYQANWNGGLVVVGTVTALPDSTHITTDLSSALGIGAGYGFALPKPTAVPWAPAMKFLAVGTSFDTGLGVAFDAEIVGNMGIIGSGNFAAPAVIAAVPTLNYSYFYPGLFNFLGTPASGTGQRQYITMYDRAAFGFGIGFPGDDYFLSIGPAQPTDSNFTLAAAYLSIYGTSSADVSITIGPYASSTASKLFVPAVSTGQSQINFANGATAPTSPLEGDLWKNGATTTAYTVGAVKLPYYVRVGGVSYQLLGV